MIGIDSAPVRLTKTSGKPNYQRPSAAHEPGIQDDPKGTNGPLKLQTSEREQQEAAETHGRAVCSPVALSGERPGPPSARAA